VGFGSVIPFFCRHSRSALKRDAPAPAAPVPAAPVEEVVADALALVDELLEEPPQAASPRQASRSTSRTAAAGMRRAGLRLLLSM
jgi:hypothetical protein